MAGLSVEAGIEQQERLLGLGLDPEEVINYERYVALHSLRNIIDGLDSTRKQEMRELTDDLQLTPFVSPAGTAIEVKAVDDRFSVPRTNLHIETFDERDSAWRAIRPHTGTWWEALRGSSARPLFLGEEMDQDRLGELSVYSADRTRRVALTPHVSFRLVASPPNEYLKNISVIE